MSQSKIKVCQQCGTPKDADYRRVCGCQGGKGHAVKRAFYDFSVAPYSFDFVSFLICARSNGCTQVVFVPGARYGIDKDGNRFEYQKCTVEEQERRLRHLLLPLCTDAIVCSSRESARELWHPGCFPPGYTVDRPTFSHLTAHVLCQKTIYPIKAHPKFVDEVRQDVGENPIVLMMRETPYRQNRNSDEAAWIKAAEWLVARGENVWFVPDTARADKVYPVGQTYRKAAESVLHRLALTEIAKLTMGVNSGGMAFAFYSRNPMLYFKPITPGSFEASKEFWERNFIQVGAQLPWFTEQQRIIWNRQDDAETLIESLEQWYAVKDGTRKWPLALAPKFPTFGVVSNEERSEHVRIAMAQRYPILKHCGAFHDRWLSLVCFGPSLKTTWQNVRRPIMAVSGAHDFLLSKGIVPDYYVACDPREEQAAFLNHPHPEVHYLMATCMHPKVWEKLKGQNVTLWHLHNGPGSEWSIRQHDPDGQLIEGGTTVGQRAMEVAARMGFKKFDIYGMDSSYDEHGDRHAGVHPGKSQNRLSIWVGSNPKEFITSPQMKEAAEEFMSMIGWHDVPGQNYSTRRDIDVRLHGKGLLQTMFAETARRDMVKSVSSTTEDEVTA